MKFKTLFSGPPVLYGSIYLILIPIFACFYYLTSGVGTNCIVGLDKFLESLYFSVVTITTLGYGDLSPVSGPARALASSEAILGLLFIGLFLNALAHRRDREESERLNQLRNDEQYLVAVSELRNFDSLIQISMESYELTSKEITNPVVAGTVQDGIYTPPPESKYNSEFKLCDMSDLYGPSLHQLKDHKKMKIEYHFDAQQDLIDIVIDLIKEVDLFRWPTLQSECLQYIETVKKFDSSDNVLGAKKIVIGEQPYIEYAAEMLADHKGDAEFLPSNAINPYVALSHSVKYSINFITSYKFIVSEILQATANDGLNSTVAARTER